MDMLKHTSSPCPTQAPAVVTPVVAAEADALRAQLLRNAAKTPVRPDGSKSPVPSQDQEMKRLRLEELKKKMLEKQAQAGLAAPSPSVNSAESGQATVEGTWTRAKLALVQWL